MTELEQYKQEVRERLKKIFKASGKSSRAFSESIGLKPTSFHKVLTGPAGLTIPLANSIELKHGYRAEWILNGKGNMKVSKRSQLSPLEICFLDVSFSSSQKWSILELLIFEKLNKNIDDQYWKNLRERVDSKIADSKRSVSQLNLERISQVFRELREEEKTCIENHDTQGQNKYALLTQTLLLATYFADKWYGVKNECAEYQELQTEDNLSDFEKLHSYINSLKEEIRE
ncbi:MAG: hypothetical protein EVA81_01875 [Proteobacteria bacterium]|nr:MAG: hypothetical protein EVA81_01875 [Pseudomonadota bacterium]